MNAFACMTHFMREKPVFFVALVLLTRGMRSRMFLALAIAISTSTVATTSSAMDAAGKKEIVGTLFDDSPAHRALGFSLGLTMIDAGSDLGFGLFFRGALLTTDRGISKDMLVRQPVWAEHLGPRSFPCAFRLPLLGATF
jgi:hypothetical protein